MMDGRLERGSRTRAAVLDVAVATASVDGLGGMSLAQLATALGVSKSGLFAHWPDKERLQLDVVAHAVEQWQSRIIAPALLKPSAVERLWTLHVLRLRFYADEVLPGRCFFVAVRPEFDDRPGPVRHAIVAATAQWLRFLTAQARAGVRAGELNASLDPAQLAFEIDALGEAAATHPSLAARRRSRRAVLERLRALATDPSVLPEE